MLMLTLMLRYGRSGLQASVSCLHGHCGDAALTRFVYCVARAAEVMARARRVGAVFSRSSGLPPRCR